MDDQGRRPVMRWQKSRASGSGNCVEVAVADELVYVRNSKRPNGTTLEFTVSEWTAFLTGVDRGEFSPTALGALSATR